MRAAHVTAGSVKNRTVPLDAVFETLKRVLRGEAAHFLNSHLEITKV